MPSLQIHEPYLATTQAEALQAECTLAITALAAEGVPLNLVAVYDDIGKGGWWVRAGGACGALVWAGPAPSLHQHKSRHAAAQP